MGDRSFNAYFRQCKAQGYCLAKPPLSSVHSIEITRGLSIRRDCHTNFFLFR